MRPGPLGPRRARSASTTSSASTIGSGGIPRLATSVPGPSSSGTTTKRWQPNPGVYETGASPVEPYFKEIRGGIGALLINSDRQSDPIAIHYSPPSLRVEWMLEQKPNGEAWVKRSASSDEDGPMRWLRESYCRLLDGLGRQYTFVTSAQIEGGGLLKGGYRVLLLPRSTALSEAEADAMRAFVKQGGILIADGRPGPYNRAA